MDYGIGQSIGAQMPQAPPERGLHELTSEQFHRLAQLNDGVEKLFSRLQGPRPTTDGMNQKEPETPALTTIHSRVTAQIARLEENLNRLAVIIG